MSKIRNAALLAGLVVGGATLANGAIALRRRDLPTMLPGDAGEYVWPQGNIRYQVRGPENGTPLVLLHGIGAGESSFEWHNNVAALSEEFRVYALDLPGFGNSERRAQDYTATLYVTAIADFLRDVVKQPAVVVASSLSGAFAVRVASTYPARVRQLVLVCPTGIEKLRRTVPIASGLAFGLMSLPGLGELLYNGIGSYNYVESYLRQNLYVDPSRVTPALVEHYWQTAHQPGARWAIRSFLSGHLVCDIGDIYPTLELPIFVAWGRQAKMTPVENANRFLQDNPNALLRVFENSGLLPHDEEAADFNRAVIDFVRGELLPPSHTPRAVQSGHTELESAPDRLPVS